MCSRVWKSWQIRQGQKILLHTEEDIYAWADEFKVEQVVKNYVSNACHHVSGDMVIEVKMVQKDGKVRVSVFNTGTPIPEADIAHIWDKFYKSIKHIHANMAAMESVFLL